MRCLVISLLLLAVTSLVLGGAYDRFNDYLRREYRRRDDDDLDDYRPGPKTKTQTKGCGISPELQAKLQALTDTVKALAKQTMILQESVEERTRTDGQSGIKQVRHDTEGTKNYHGSTHIDTGVAGVHDHSDYIRLLGMGEVDCVINGVNFRTRHNDYRLVRKSTTSKAYGAVEDIPFPDVPPSVKRLTDPDAQIEEMRQYFVAWATQNVTHRDYTNYFKPVISYMEAMWTTDADNELTEPYYSDRHHLDARSWDDLMTKARYMSYTGNKDNFENLGFFPRKIMSVDPVTGIPTYAQWNYRILCHPINMDIPFKYLKQREDLSWRYPRSLTLSEVKAETRAARFALNADDDDEQFTTFTILDKIFQTIPGMDNIVDPNLIEGYGGRFGSAEGNNITLIQGNYHRFQRWAELGAMGSDVAHRGFSDQYMFVAVNTQDKIVPMAMEDCKLGVCKKYSARVSYAIPMEIIYMTPLLSWNPYNIVYNEDPSKTTEGGMDGETDDTAYKGVDFKHYYRTPSKFFNGPPLEPDDADTPKEVVKVRNIQDQVVNVTASGTTFMLRNIDGCGMLRLRYPIHPIHGEGSPVWKELSSVWAVNQKFNSYP